MWSSDASIARRAVLVGAVAVLGGCGFVPAYGTNGAASALSGQVEIETPDTVAGFRLADNLRARLGDTTGEPLYRLVTRLDIRETGVAVTREGAVTRLNLVGVATFQLIRLSDGTTVLDGTSDSFTSYSTTDSTVATESARDDAEERLAAILADQILTQIQIGMA